MSFELGEALRRCALESGGRRDLLEALATYADDETGLATVSQLSLALHAGVTERHARRILAALVADPRLEGLVRQISKPSGAAGRPSTGCGWNGSSRWPRPSRSPRGPAMRAQRRR
ncbi:MAG: hypothetical protein IPK75_01410 [Acidobacteria bacterium]|nr:hypothetical protein [Acidobacteriota bacterium]